MNKKLQEIKDRIDKIPRIPVIYCDEKYMHIFAARLSFAECCELIDLLKTYNEYGKAQIVQSILDKRKRKKDAIEDSLNAQSSNELLDFIAIQGAETLKLN